MPPTSSRVDTLLFVHAVDTTHQWEKLTLVTWDNMDDFHFFEKKEARYKSMDCIIAIT